MILQTPGATIRVMLQSTLDLPPDEQVFVELRVLDRGERQWIDGMRESGLPSFEIARRCIGKQVLSIEGLKIQSGEPWEMARGPDGFLTNTAAEFLIPIQIELITMIGQGATLTPIEKKQPSSP